MCDHDPFPYPCQCTKEIIKTGSMKAFNMKHKYFNHMEQFTIESPPGWLVSKEYRWWYVKHVLTLEVGESISSDFRIITRVE